VELAAECRASRLILFHHEPEHDDGMIDRLLAKTQQEAKHLAPRLTVDAASEGMQLNL
jgi:phosphoribosyl 1,2-cyclic phosphodiesterase